jgi:hypothetical protein
MTAAEPAAQTIICATECAKRSLWCPQRTNEH